MLNIYFLRQGLNVLFFKKIFVFFFSFKILAINRRAFRSQTLLTLNTPWFMKYLQLFFCLFILQLLPFSLILTFLVVFLLIFCLKINFFIKTEVKIPNKAMTYLWVSFFPHLSVVWFLSFLSAPDILLDRTKESFFVSLLLFKKNLLLWMKVLSSHCWRTKSLKC